MEYTEQIRQEGIAQDLKKDYPIYPQIKPTPGMGSFITLVRKRFEGKYFLLKTEVKCPEVSLCVHRLHSTVYNILMNGEYNSQWILDNEQIIENIRLKNLKE